MSAKTECHGCGDAVNNPEEGIFCEDCAGICILCDQAKGCVNPCQDSAKTGDDCNCECHNEHGQCTGKETQDDDD